MSSQESRDPWPTTPAETRATPAASPLPPEEGGVKPGDRLGSYELLALLGKGGTGMVFRTRHVRLKKEFALKVLSPRLARARKVILRFERETEALDRLEHVNLVRASDADVEQDVPYKVQGRRSRPAFAFPIAFRPDGTWDLRGVAEGKALR